LFPVFSLIRDACHSYENLSPFSAVRWQDDRPEVQVAEKWYELVQIDDISATEIVAFCDYRYLGQAGSVLKKTLSKYSLAWVTPPMKRAR
jgi:hypothetical protein